MTPGKRVMKNRNRHGFSMIEVMVAATILVVIVMMLGMLFQQTSVAWRTGLMRNDGYMQLRAFIGAIQRDASAMVDANQIPEDLRYMNKKQEFTSDSIQFYTLAGALPTKSGGTLEDFRALNFIVYDINGTRTSYRLEPNGTSWEKQESDILDFLTDSSDPDKPQVNATRFNVAFQDGKETDIDGNTVADANRYPLFLTVAAKVTQRGRMYDVGAECAGPDGTFGTLPTDAASKDDIRTWSR